MYVRKFQSAQSRHSNKKPQFAGLEKDEVIPREWLAKMDKWQHELEYSVHWDQGDVLIIDASVTRCFHKCVRSQS